MRDGIDTRYFYVFIKNIIIKEGERMNYQFAKRIIASENVENKESLLVEKALQIGLGEVNCAVFKGKSYVILDFGREVSGGVRILTFDVVGSKRVRLRFGESVAETCSELGNPSGYMKATNDHSIRDFEVDLQNYSDMTFGQTGYRFLRIDVLNEDSQILMKTAVAAVDTDTREEIGGFECDDPLVNEIWKTAAYTIRLCLQNGYFWDGIKRDRLVWIGDLYPEMRAAQCLFGDVPEVVNSLEFVKAETPLPKWMNNIPSYSLWWMIILAEEYAMFGAKPEFNAYLPYVKGLLEQFSQTVREDGSLTFGWNFVDWPTNYIDGDVIEKKLDSATGVAYIMKIAMTKIKAFLKDYGEDTSLCEDILRRLENTPLVVKKYKQIAGIGVWAGDVSARNKEILLEGGAKGLSTFMSYPILTGVAAYGEYEAALNMMKEYYGGMLSVGATTFWEDFDIEWLKNAGRIDEMPKAGEVDIHGEKGAFCYIGYRHSFCHGWSAGVIPYLVETVLGVKMTGTGMRRMKIEPHLSGLKYVKGSVPTSYGLLHVEHTLQADGTIATKVSAPKEIVIE